MSYDPDARRDTPLALKLKERIRRNGPITIAQYMEACLQDPEHGYYRTRGAIGAKGDFVTAPEISQTFGELIGLWCAVVWQQMGSPAKFNIVELGPGRGTLMADALRATRIVPGFHDAASVEMIESNTALRTEQRGGLAAHERVQWRATLAELGSSAPTVAIGNEYLDVLPIEQAIGQSGTWRERRVITNDDGSLTYAVGPPVMTPRAVAFGHDGAVLEWSRARAELASQLASQRSRARAFAALFIDYGHARSGAGDTLQAVRNHAHEHPLTSPGEADLTAQVDFEAFANDCSAVGLAVDGPVTQANFLGSLGIMQRAAKLMSANPARAHDIEAGVARLMAVPGMGDRFKAIGVRSDNLPPLPGFASQ